MTFCRDPPAPFICLLARPAGAEGRSPPPHIDVTSREMIICWVVSDELLPVTRKVYYRIVGYL